MRKIVFGLGLITVIGVLIGVICVICGYLWAGTGTWSEGTATAFSGTYSNTQPINANLDCTLFTNFIKIPLTNRENLL
jgi:hypothetical protein